MSSNQQLESAQTYFNKGNELKKQGKLNQAIASYRKAIELNPNQCWFYQKLGEALAGKGQHKQAVDAYRKAIEVNPLFVQPYIKLRYIPIKPGQLNDLIATYRQVTYEKPNSSVAWLNLGDALTRQGKLDEAINCYQTGIQKRTLARRPKLAELDWKPQKECGPDFIIIGAGKSGTSSLFRYLSHHPQVLLPQKKELGFFDRHFSKGIDWYLAHFPSITDRPDFLTGEATPGYISSPGVEQLIFQMFPEVKLIALLRNPVDRTISAHYHAARGGYEKRSLEEVINSAIKQLEQATEEDLASLYLKDLQLLKSLYVYQLKRWLALFPKEQFLILKSEDFYSNTAAAMNQVFDFLGLPQHYHRDYSGNSPSKKYNSGSYDSISDDLRHTLSEFFRPHNQKLEELLSMEFNWKN